MSAVVSVGLLGACGGWGEQGGEAPALVEGARDAVAGDVVVTLSVPRVSLAASEAVRVTVTLANVSSDAVRLLKRRTPVDGLRGDLFVVTVDGARAQYKGRLYKWAPTQETAYLRLGSGESVSYTVDLDSFYDLSRTGRYSIRYDSAWHPADEGTGGASQLRSDNLSIDIEGRPFVGPGARDSGTVTAQELSTEGCTERPASTLSTAYSTARSMANDAYVYMLDPNLIPVPRFTTWFGTVNTASVNAVRSHFTAIKSAFDSKQVVIDCTCTDDDAYSYVYPDRPYRIFVCNGFWARPMTGTDSMGGILIHEMSHFTVLGGTNDWAFGQSDCKKLATANPALARDNADSHEYLAEWR
ncbi:M35 family metallo-endopeptidase [Vitiosangium sp. GDMCC 1.1324]|uniref:M35 family metallo-endopeptidase n=1 Tax=Vitiosangium sp. (strain GDMCC 1.1324) TaxID=2138576 RepID=UPI001E328C15|nr:M35 family metallo-endopeptidase [Vitiosangium sp. GDMCC 1.1324]